jgi:hypothetical protein
MATRAAGEGVEVGVGLVSAEPAGLEPSADGVDFARLQDVSRMLINRMIVMVVFFIQFP